MIQNTLVRYIVVSPEDVLDNFQMILNPTEDFLSIGILDNAIVIYPRPFPGQESDIRVVSFLISDELQKEIADQVGIENPLSDENVAATLGILGLSNVYRSLDTVKIDYPETAGTFEIISKDEAGNEVTITHEKMIPAGWAL